MVILDASRLALAFHFWAVDPSHVVTTALRYVPLCRSLFGPGPRHRPLESTIVYFRAYGRSFLLESWVWFIVQLGALPFTTPAGHGDVKRT